MNRICTSLVEAGYSSLLVGRKLEHSLPIDNKKYDQFRIKCWINKSFLFYAEYNIRLFLFLLKQPADAINAIDLDTILACFLAAKLKRIPIVYDAHEYFTEQEEIVERPFIKKIWTSIEYFTIPKIKTGYTVSNGYAKLFKQKYNVDYNIVRNVTKLRPITKEALINNEGYILYQGAVNYGRGLDILIDAMVELPNEKLMICGKGDIYYYLVEKVKRLNLEKQITFKGFVKPEDLSDITLKAKIGLTLFEEKGLSHKFSLANRFFDYIHNGVPQIAMNYPEYEEFNKKHQVAMLIESISTESIKNAILTLQQNHSLYKNIQENTLKARLENSWKNDAKTLVSVYDKLFQ